MIEYKKLIVDGKVMCVTTAGRMEMQYGHLRNLKGVKILPARESEYTLQTKKKKTLSEIEKLPLDFSKLENRSFYDI